MRPFRNIFRWPRIERLEPKEALEVTERVRKIQEEHLKRDEEERNALLEDLAVLKMQLEISRRVREGGSDDNP